MVRIAPAVRALVILLLLASTTGGGWMAACARPGEAAAQPSPAAPHHAMHEGMHGGEHQHAPAHRPTAPADRPEQPECPVLAMTGGGCTLAADAATLDLSLTRTRTPADAYPAAAGVHDRLLADAFFHPPQV
ncbi:MAG: hypothetical protein ACJ8GN_22005 [Longimicrobiaceae bacterium]